MNSTSSCYYFEKRKHIDNFDEIDGFDVYPISLERKELAGFEIPSLQGGDYGVGDPDRLILPDIFRVRRPEIPNHETRFIAISAVSSYR